MKKNVFLIDDNSQLTKMMSEFLSLSGFSIDTETDSRKALQRFNDSPDKFDLIITDQTMPGISGFELAKQILAQRPGLPVFICTGYDEDLDEKKAIDAGISRFFFKPVELHTLVNNINEVCEKQTSLSVTLPDN